MRGIRSRVRAVALAWLLCQAASLAAFMPGELLYLARRGASRQKQNRKRVTSRSRLNPSPATRVKCNIMATALRARCTARSRRTAAR